MRFQDLRREYAGAPLDETAAGPDPVALFERWFQEAVSAGIRFADGMVLATADASGQPSARVVLLKGFGPDGFLFFTSYQSSKSDDLARNPAAALLFWWPELHRQVRVEGDAARAPAAESDAYFAGRPRASNLSAMASVQSQPVDSRAALEQAVAACAASWQDRELVRPASWGGFRLAPRQFEFWQGREDRLHDRLRFSRTDGQPWTRARLSP